MVLSQISFGQDTIYLKDGSKYAAKIIEINANDVKYKKFNNQDGPLYSDTKNNISRIRYENGMSDMFSTTPAASETPVIVQSPKQNADCRLEKDGPHFYCSGTRLNKNEVLMQIKSRAYRLDNLPLKESYKSYQLNKGLHTGLSVGAIPFFVVGGFFYVAGSFINQLGGSSEIMERGIVFLALGGVVEVGAIVAFVNKNIRFNQAIKLYNESL